MSIFSQPCHLCVSLHAEGEAKIWACHCRHTVSILGMPQLVRDGSGAVISSFGRTASGLMLSHVRVLEADVPNATTAHAHLSAGPLGHGLTAVVLVAGPYLMYSTAPCFSPCGTRFAVYKSGGVNIHATASSRCGTRQTCMTQTDSSLLSLRHAEIARP